MELGVEGGGEVRWSYVRGSQSYLKARRREGVTLEGAMRDTCFDQSAKMGGGGIDGTPWVLGHHVTIPQALKRIPKRHRLGSKG